MLKMREKIENRGMSLIEVIVSMLVLSIAVVTVMSAFSMASKTNLQSKRHQDVESVMESFLEYAEAGGTDYQSAFTVAATDYSVSVTGAVKEETLNNIKQGFGTYNVTVTTDTAPAKYSSAEFNNHDVIQFGGSGSNTVLIDASLEQNKVETSYHTWLHGADYTAYEYFWLWHSQAVDEFNDAHEDDADFSEMFTIPISGIGAYIDRELQIMTTEPEPNKMQLMASFVYTINDAAVLLPTSLGRTYSVLIYLSPVYDAGHVTTVGANKLDQVYIMYSDGKEEPDSIGENIDIRILDTDSPNKRLNATIFLVDQEGTSMGIGTAVGKASFEDRVDNRHKTLRISFKNLTNGHVETPQAKLYCSVNAQLEAADGYVTYNNAENGFNLVAKGNEVRVVTVTVEVADADTGTVIDTKTITRLQ